MIECIFFDGLVPRSEADEYVQIANLSAGPISLEGWRLQDVSDGSPTFTFPTIPPCPGKGSGFTPIKCTRNGVGSLSSGVALY